MDKKEVGERLRKLRGDRAVAEVARAVGISQPSLTLYELGERTPRDEVKRKLADFYGVTVGELFFA